MRYKSDESKTAFLHIRVDADTHKKLRAYAARKRKPLSDLCREKVKELLKDE